MHLVVDTCLQCVESAGCRERQRGVQRNSDQKAEVLWKSLCCLPYASFNDPHLARASRSSKADSVPKLSYFCWQPLFRNWCCWSFCSLSVDLLNGVGMLSFAWVLVRYPRYTSADGEIDMAPLGNRGDQPDGVRDLIGKRRWASHAMTSLQQGDAQKSQSQQKWYRHNWSVVQWCIPWYPLVSHVIPYYSCETPCLLSQDMRKRRWRAKSEGRRALTKARELMPAVCSAHGNVRNQRVWHSRIAPPKWYFWDISKWGTHTNPAKSTRKWLLYVDLSRKPTVFLVHHFQEPRQSPELRLMILPARQCLGWDFLEDVAAWECGRDGVRLTFWSLRKLILCLCIEKKVAEVCIYFDLHGDRPAFLHLHAETLGQLCFGSFCWCSRGSTCCQRLGWL